MASSISDLIYKKFFENLAKGGNTKPETIETIRVLYENGNIANKNELKKLVQAMEERHVKNQAPGLQ